MRCWIAGAVSASAGEDVAARVGVVAGVGMERVGAGEICGEHATVSRIGIKQRSLVFTLPPPAWHCN